MIYKYLQIKKWILHISYSPGDDQKTPLKPDIYEITLW